MAIPGIDAASAAFGLLTSRHAGGSFTVGGIDLLLGLASQSILSFGYMDNTSDQADNLTIQIADPARTWMQTYLPKKGVECTAEIKVFNWTTLGDMRTFDCGIFWLDQIDFAGPPNVVSVSAVSIPVVTGIKNEKRWQGWEGTDMQKVAEQIATDNGMTLKWDTKQYAAFKLDRIDEEGSPDLEFLREKLREQSLNFKIHKKQIVVYSEEELESRPAVYVITYAMDNIIDFQFSSKLDDTYKEAEVTYSSPKTGTTLKEGFSAPNPPPTEAVERSNERLQDELGYGGSSDDMLREFSAPINTATSGSEEAKRKAKAKLREKNKKEKECMMTFLGNPDYRSGLNVQLVGFGIFDGKWFISSAVHEISSDGYKTSLAMRACLDGY